MLQGGTGNTIKSAANSGLQRLSRGSTMNQKFDESSGMGQLLATPVKPFTKSRYSQPARARSGSDGLMFSNSTFNSASNVKNDGKKPLDNLLDNTPFLLVPSSGSSKIRHML